MPHTADSRSETEKRDLRTGQPLWLSDGPPKLAVRQTPRHTRYDVIIAGSGISGALTAWHLCDGKRRVLLIDRRPPLTGSTPASLSLIHI